MEFMAVSSTPYDTDRFGAALPRFSPRQSDLLMVVGTLTPQAGADPAQGLRADVRAEVGDGVRRVRDERRLLPELRRASPGIDKIIPVDIYVPGCPPRPETVIDAIMKLQDRIARDRSIRSSREQRSEHGRDRSSSCCSSDSCRRPTARRALSHGDRCVLGASRSRPHAARARVRRLKLASSRSICSSTSPRSTGPAAHAALRRRLSLLLHRRTWSASG